MKEFDAVFIGTGLSADKEYFVEGSAVSNDHVLSALDYLGRARKYEENKGDLPYTGKHVGCDWWGVTSPLMLLYWRNDWAQSRWLFCTEGLRTKCLDGRANILKRRN